MIREFPAPPALVGQLRAGRAGVATTGEQAPIRDAATVMLVRDGAAGVEVFCFRRVATMAFAAGMHVFPGGRVDVADADPQVPWHGPDPALLGAALGAGPELARALVVAAVRETFEECGVLLAAPPGGGPVVGLGAGWDAVRTAVLDRTVTLSAALREAGLAVRADTLVPWARWVTPAGESRRYDTRFFLVPMPPGQQARDLGGEGEGAGWVPAGEAVRRWGAGEVAMLPPTVVCVQELAAGPDVAALLAAERVIAPVMPWAAPTGDGGFVVRADVDGHGGGSLGDPATVAAAGAPESA